MNPETTLTAPADNQVAVRLPKPPVLANERGVSFSNMDDMWRFCLVCVNSGQFKDITTPEIALIRLQAGMELGLSPIWSLTNIMVTNGRPSVWGDALLGIVKARPDCDDVLETATGKFPDDDYTAVCEVRRRGKVPTIREFSVADAKKAGIFGKNVHAQYPKRMLQMRARAFACRDAFPDALRGLGMREEMEGITEPKRVEARVTSTAMVLPGDVEEQAVRQVAGEMGIGHDGIDRGEEENKKRATAEGRVDKDGNFIF